MSIRKKILLPMITLTVVCVAAILAASIWLFNRSLDDAARSRISMAAAGAEHELEAYKTASHMAAVIVAESSEIIEAVANDDHDAVLAAAGKIPAAAQVDFCTILDSEGYVLARTHDPDNYGGSLLYQSNISHALEGEVFTGVERGTAVLLSVRTGAPIIDEHGDVIGVASLGYRFDTPSFVNTIKDMTGCEVALYLGYDRISSTVSDLGGASAEGAMTTGETIEIIDRVLFGETDISRMTVNGRSAIAAYSPIYGVDDQIVGILAVASYTDDDMGRIREFVASGLIICVAIIAIAVPVAIVISNTIDKRINDMMERIRESEKLKAALANAKNVSKSKSEFMANMSHEIRTPLNVILGVTEMRLHDESLSQEARRELEQVFDSGKLLLSIASDIIDHSKIEAGKLEIKPSEYDVPSLVCDSAQLNRLRYDDKPIEFRLEIDPNTPLSLIGDVMRLKQILNNLLSNAYKYTNEGEIKLKVYPDSDRLVFEVSDTGQGMTEEQLGMLFEEYTRFNLETNRSTEGVGLGLKITKQLVEMMGGEIVVKSEAGKGSVFTVSIPQERKDDTVCGEGIAKKLREFRYKRTQAITTDINSYAQMPDGRVLLVDDVKSNIYVAKRMLMPYGLQIDTAESGFAAIELVQAGNEYDIIFMDHMMPRMNGIEAAKILREMGYDRCIIVLTANALVGQADIFLANGFDGYLSKPIDTRELNNVLMRFIKSAEG